VDFLEVVGSRRSVRWFKPWKAVEPEKIQRILEAARLTGCPGNVQPWRAVVVVVDELEPADRERLLTAANRQPSLEQAPVWVYWFGDPDAARPDSFDEQLKLGHEVGMTSEAAGWDGAAVRRAIDAGTPVPVGMPALHEILHGLPYEGSAQIAIQQTNAACAVATLAAVNEGLGTCLHLAAAPSAIEEVTAVLGVPDRFVLVWMQLLGYPAEGSEAGGQRPRLEFGELFCKGRWGQPLPRDPAIVEELTRRGLLQAPAPLPGRQEELAALARMFGYSAVAEHPAGGAA